MAARQIRDLSLNTHVNIMCIGDPLKSLLLPFWASPTMIPRVHFRAHNYKPPDTDKMLKCKCNVWDIVTNTDAAHRMFPQDGTMHTGMDFCLIFYDAISRIKSEGMDRYISVKDQLTGRQHADRPCVTMIIIIKTPRTAESEYAHVKDLAAAQKVNCITVNNTQEGLKKASGLPADLCNRVMDERHSRLTERIGEILRPTENPAESVSASISSSSLKNG